MARREDRRWWYRIVSRHRTSRSEVLTSKWGRFHDDPDVEPTSYGADSLLTAWMEVTARFGSVPANAAAFNAWRMLVDEEKIIDLRNRREQARWGITEVELLSDPASPKCREVARVLRGADTAMHGLVYPSVRNRPNGVCVALFLEHVRPSAVEHVLKEWENFSSSLRP